MMGDIQARFQLAWSGFTLDVDLSMPGHGVTALYGHSGSGKTTLLRCMAGLERPAVGHLSVNGALWQGDGVWVPPHQRTVGYVFQEPSLFAHLSVAGNVRYGLKRAPGNADANMDKVVELLGIRHLLDRKPDRLSGGERQRVAIARALAVRPQLLLMDEPLAALDLDRKREILPYLERLHDELDIPVLYVSHSPDEVARLADHIVVMEGGKAIAAGPLNETLSRIDLPIRLGHEAGVVLDAVVGEHDAQWHLMRLDFPGGSLWARAHQATVGRKVRVRVLARDVSLSEQCPQRTSIQNLMPATVDRIADDEHPGLALVRVHVGPSVLVARLTHKSVEALGIRPGAPVWAQVKSVALAE